MSTGEALMTLNEIENLEKSVEEAVAEVTAPQQKIADFNRRKAGSVAEQMLAAAESIKAVHREIDQLQEDVTMRLTAIRKMLGGKG